MQTTVIIDDVATRVALADGHDGGLWLGPEDAARVARWEIGSDGACRGARCVPLPPDAVAGDGAVDLAALARHLGQPVLHDAAHGVWLIGDEPDELRDRLASLEAPDFTLPDLDGRLHALTDHRGHKVLLVTWASW
jgi:hypothetical protein